MPRLVLVLILLALAVPALAGDMPPGFSRLMPLKVDTAAGSVSFLAEVNPKMAKAGQTLQHLVVDQDGNDADKALLQGHIQPRLLYEALVLLGFKAGENMTTENMNRTRVQGDALRVAVLFEGATQAVDISQLVKDPGGRGIDLRFGGNLKAAQGNESSGCLICLFSCPMGTVSNHETLFQETDSLGQVKYTAQGLPEKGGWAVVTISRRN